MTRERRKVACDDCFFRRADLCAIAGNIPCPTFRLAGARRTSCGRRARGGPPAGRSPLAPEG